MPAKNTASDHSFKVTKVAAPLRQQVLESIRTSIAVGRYKAGERVTERALLEMTGVSRTLVREALRQLESEGLITVLPTRGTVVATLSAAQAQSIYQVRRELEGLASELFAQRASAEDLLALRKALKALEVALDSKDPIVRLKAKNDFYDCLVRGAGNEALGQTLNMLNSRIMVLRATSLKAKGRAVESIRELGALVDALEKRDGQAARRAAVHHVENAAKAALAILGDGQD